MTGLTLGVPLRRKWIFLASFFRIDAILCCPSLDVMCPEEARSFLFRPFEEEPGGVGNEGVTVDLKDRLPKDKREIQVCEGRLGRGGVTAGARCRFVGSRQAGPEHSFRCPPHLSVRSQVLCPPAHLSLKNWRLLIPLSLPRFSVTVYTTLQSLHPIILCCKSALAS